MEEIVRTRHITDPHIGQISEASRGRQLFQLKVELPGLRWEKTFDQSLAAAGQGLRVQALDPWERRRLPCVEFRQLSDVREIPPEERRRRGPLLLGQQQQRIF